MRTGEAPALDQQGEADSLQSGSFVGFATQDASDACSEVRVSLDWIWSRSFAPKCSVLNRYVIVYKNFEIRRKRHTDKQRSADMDVKKRKCSSSRFWPENRRIRHWGS